MKISITEVPQADELNKVILTVEAVQNDYKSDQKIADYVGFTDRQGRYYRLAAEILGLLKNENNSAFLTKTGNELIILDEENRLKKSEQFCDKIIYLIKYLVKLKAMRKDLAVLKS